MIARVGQDLPVDGAEVFEVPRGRDRRAGPDRHPRPPARAGPGAQGNDRDRHGVGGRRRLHRRRVHAEHRSGQRPRRHHAVHPQEGGRGAASRASIRSARCRSARGRAARRARRAEGRRLRRLHRRRPAGGDGAADAPRARVRRACSACRSSTTARTRRSRGTASRTRASTPRRSACAAFPASPSR